MSDVKNSEPGSFCWFELTTTNTAGAKAFYSELLGWSYDDQSMPDGGTYSMSTVGGRHAAAITAMRAEDKQHGIPSHWGPYISVKNADETAKKATSLGGKLLMEPFDVMDAGRMAVVQDPSGAVFSLWQAGNHVGIGVEQEPGAYAWAELATRDVAACRDFYSKLFDWDVRSFDAGAMPYWLFDAKEKERAGMMAMPANTPAQMPSMWTIYFAVNNCDETVTRAQSMGGKLLVAAMEVPNTGRFAIVSDPQGAAFGVLQPAR